MLDTESAAALLAESGLGSPARQSLSLRPTDRATRSPSTSTSSRRDLNGIELWGLPGGAASGERRAGRPWPLGTSCLRSTTPRANRGPGPRHGRRVALQADLDRRGAQDSANRPSDPRPWLQVTRGARPVGLGREVARPAGSPAWSPRVPVGEGRAPTARLPRPIADPASSQMPAETSWNLVRVMRSTEPSGMVTS